MGASLERFYMPTKTKLDDKNKIIFSINNADKKLLNSITTAAKAHPIAILSIAPQRMNDSACHSTFITEIQKIYKNDKSGTLPYDVLSSHHRELTIEWERIIRAAIAILRKADTREPFRERSHSQINPSAYGVTHLKEFFQKFVDFEDVLYGADRWYRDHVVHAYRVWLLGLDFLLKEKPAGGIFADDFSEAISLEVKCDLGLFCSKDIEQNIPNSQATALPIDAPKFVYSYDEIIAIWSIAALTHDLGYPLEKAPKILRSIQDMMANFVCSPDLRQDLRFNTAADSINDYVVRLISTRMSQYRPYFNDVVNEKVYVGRVQPKFYIKFLKSLETSRHGIISSIVLYKSLLYFLETDCNISEDYRFTHEDVRQFYARREILRSIASHTCSDVYQMYVASFSFLLFFCDELQDWGRNKYHGIRDSDIHFFPPEVVEFSKECIEIKQSYAIKRFKPNDNLDSTSIAIAAKRIQSEFEKFRLVYRDGIDTTNRKFSFKKSIQLEICDLDLPITIVYSIPANSEATIYYEHPGLSADKIVKHIKAIQTQKISVAKNDSSS